MGHCPPCMSLTFFSPKHCGCRHWHVCRLPSRWTGHSSLSRTRLLILHKPYLPCQRSRQIIQTKHSGLEFPEAPLWSMRQWRHCHKQVRLIRQSLSMCSPQPWWLSCYTLSCVVWPISVLVVQDSIWVLQLRSQLCQDQGGKYSFMQKACSTQYMPFYAMNSSPKYGLRVAVQISLHDVECSRYHSTFLELGLLRPRYEW